MGIGIRYLDLVLLALALPLFLIADLPIAGYIVLALAWLAQRGIQLWAQRQAVRSLKNGVRRNAVGMIAGALLLRLWVVTLAILLVGKLGDREDGLAAAIMAFVLVTVSFASEALTRALEGEEEAS